MFSHGLVILGSKCVVQAQNGSGLGYASLQTEEPLLHHQELFFLDRSHRLKESPKLMSTMSIPAVSSAG